MAEARTMNPLAKFALDLGPLLIFFAANSLFKIYVATAVFMVVMTIAIAIGVIVERRLAPMPIFTGILVLVFGGLTLWLEDDTFIKIKPTILYLIFAAIILSGLVSKRLFIKTMMGATIQLPETAWRALTWRWGAFFIVMAVANELAWRNFSTDTWVAFKLWGVFPATIAFMVSQMPFIARHQIDDELPVSHQE